MDGEGVDCVYHFEALVDIWELVDRWQVEERVLGELGVHALLFFNNFN